MILSGGRFDGEKVKDYKFIRSIMLPEMDERGVIWIHEYDAHTGSFVEVREAGPAPDG